MSFLSDLSKKRISVVGDNIVDLYRFCKAKRLSPEAPVPIFEPLYKEYRAGGAANVASNLRALGVGHVHLITVFGTDNYNSIPSEDLNKMFPEGGILGFEKNRLTTIKERIVTRRQQICRIDSQSGKPILSSTANSLFEAAKEFLIKSDAIIFSDYDHGTCISELVSLVLNLAIAKGIPTIIDSKAKDTILKYKGSTIALPNMDEARMMTNLGNIDDEKVAKYILYAMALKAAAITLGPRGIMLAENGNVETYHPLDSNVNNEVVDVTGAGDTVAAMVAAGLTLGLKYWQIMKLANVAAGIKVQKLGVATVTQQEILAAIETHNIELESDYGRNQNN